MLIIMRLLIGLIISLWLCTHYLLWCMWYLEVDWNKFILRRFRWNRHLNLEIGEPDLRYGRCVDAYEVLKEENFKQTITRWLNLNIL